MADRVEPEDTVPEEIDGYLYYVRFVEDGQFPVYCRRKADSSNAPEEVTLPKPKRRLHSYSSILAFPNCIENILYECRYWWTRIRKL
jgi:oligopeptidase B